MVKLESPMTLVAKGVLEELFENRKDIGKDTNKVGELKLVNCTIKSIQKVEKAVNGYSNSWNIFYRIWNAVKACFGMSDWQCAKRSLHQLKNELAKEFAPTIRAAFGIDSTDAKDKKSTALFKFLVSESTENKVFSSLADAALYAMIGMNKHKSTKLAMNLEMNPKLDEKQKNEIIETLKKDPLIKNFDKNSFEDLSSKIKEAIKCFVEPKPDQDD